MKSKKIISIILALLMTASALGFSAFAEDVTEPVKADPGNVTVDGNVNVVNESYAVYAQSIDRTDANVTVKGNVTLTISDPAYASEAAAVDIYGADPNCSATAYVTGDVSAKKAGDTGAIFALSAVNGELTVDGSAYADGGASDATGIYSDDGNVTVGNDVKATGVYSTGVAVYGGEDAKHTVEVKGPVYSSGEDATGVMLTTQPYTDAFPEIAATFGDGITTVSTATDAPSDDSYYSAVGINVDNNGGKITANIAGDITAKGPDSQSAGIYIGSMYMEQIDNAGDGTNSILVHGNVISDGYGIFKVPAMPTSPEEETPTVVTDILVENEIDAANAGVMMFASPVLVIPDFPDGNPATATDPGENLNLTVWKIKLNDRGNAAEIMEGEWIEEPDNSHMEYKPHTAEDFEKSIMYIVKAEQPDEGGTIKAVDAEGN